MCLSPSIQEKQVIADTIFMSNMLFSFLMVYQFLKYDTNGMQITIKDISCEFKWNANGRLKVVCKRRTPNKEEKEFHSSNNIAILLIWNEIFDNEKLNLKLMIILFIDAVISQSSHTKYLYSC